MVGSKHRSSSTRSAPAATLVIGTGGVVALLLSARRQRYTKADPTWTHRAVSADGALTTITSEPHWKTAPNAWSKASIWPSGVGLVAFFAVMYYSALRPGKALNLRKTNLLLPDASWGELLFDQSCPSVGMAWSDSGTRREQRQLKHRAKGDTRSAPCPPELTQLLHDHLSRHGTDSEGRLFRGVRSGRKLEESTYHRVWRKLAMRHSPPRNTPHRSHADPTTSATPRYPRG